MERTHVAYEKLRAYMAEMLVKGLGFPEETAEISSVALVEADARGPASLPCFGRL